MLCVRNTYQGPVVVKKFLRHLAQSVKARHCWSYQTNVFEQRLLFGLTSYILPLLTLPERIYNPITAMGFSAMFTFQLDNTKG